MIRRYVMVEILWWHNYNSKPYRPKAISIEVKDVLTSIPKSWNIVSFWDLKFLPYGIGCAGEVTEPTVIYLLNHLLVYTVLHSQEPLCHNLYNTLLFNMVGITILMVLVAPVVAGWRPKIAGILPGSFVLNFISWHPAILGSQTATTCVTSTITELKTWEQWAGYEKMNRPKCNVFPSRVSGRGYKIGPVSVKIEE